MPRLPSLRRKNATPARQVTGTTYASSPAVPVPPANYTEIGSAGSALIRDPVPELGTKTNQIRMYKKMVRSDASVRVSLRAGKAPVLGGDYYIEPFDEQPENLAIAEFVTFNLFNGMTTTWHNILFQILKMYENGNSVFEEVWELREWSPKKSSPTANRRKYTMLRKLAYRPSETLTGIEYDDNGGPSGVGQKAIDAKGQTKDVSIPIEKLVIFTFDPDGTNIEGESILRSAYENWFYKYHLYKIDAIQKERHGIGVPEVELQPGYSSNDLKWAHELAANLRTNERAHIVRTTMMKIGFAELQGNVVDALESAMHHDDMIMKNVMVQFLNLGVGGSGGGRATASTSMDMFLKSMRYVANTICDSINSYLIPKLVAYNFQTDQFPALRVKNVGEAKDLQMWAAAMANLVDKGLVTMDDDTEQWVRLQVDAPKKMEPRPEAPPVGAPPAGNLSGGASTNGGGTGVTSGNIGKSPSSGAV